MYRQYNATRHFRARLRCSLYDLGQFLPRCGSIGDFQMTPLLGLCRPSAKRGVEGGGPEKKIVQRSDSLTVLSLSLIRSFLFFLSFTFLCVPSDLLRVDVSELL